MEVTELQPVASDFELLTVIGTGCNNTVTVTLAKHLPTQSPVAIKRINLDQCTVNFSMIQHEVSYHKLLSHPNMMPALCSFVCGSEVWIVMPLAGFGSCRDLLHAHFCEGFPEVVIAIILRDVLQALDYLHRRGIVHRSVKASHILVSGTGHVMLSGLKYSCSMMETGKRARAIFHFPDNFTGSLLWASPELLEQNLAGYDTKSDIYSLGIVACELANGIVPFSDIPSTQMLLEKLQGVMPKLLDSVTMETNAEMEPDNPYRRTFTSHFHNFVELCLLPEASSRPSVSSLLQHTFFKQVKRKSQMLPLPSLLNPVQPLTSVELPRDAVTVDDLAQSLGAAAIGDGDAWDFS